MDTLITTGHASMSPILPEIALQITQGYELYRPLEKTLILRKIECRRRRGRQRTRWLDCIIDSIMNLSKLQEMVKDREPGVLQSMGLRRVRHELATKQQRGVYILKEIRGKDILASGVSPTCCLSRAPS